MRPLDPMLRLPCADRVRELPPEAKAALRAVLLDLRTDARAQAANAVKRGKGPMYAYWQAVAVYAFHFARLARP